MPLNVYAAKAMLTAKTISEVKLAGGNKPLAGEHPTFSWSVHTFDEKMYRLDSAKWYYYGERREKVLMNENDVFQRGKAYNLEAKFIQNAGYQFVNEANLKASFYNFDEGFDVISTKVYENINTNTTTAVVNFGFMIPYEVSFDTGGGTLIPSQEVEPGKTAKEPEKPKKDGYTFKGWYLTSDFSTPKIRVDLNPIDGNTTYYALFVKANDSYQAKLYDLDLGTYEAGYQKIEKTGFKIENTGIRPFAYTKIELSGKDLDYFGCMMVASKILNNGSSSDTLQKVIITPGLGVGVHTLDAKLLVSDTKDGN